MPKYIDSSNSSLAKENKTNNSKKKKKWTEDPVNTSPKTKMAKEHTKRWSTLLIIREMQMKILMRYHITPVKIAIIKKSANSKSWRKYRHCWWECKLI